MTSKSYFEVTENVAKNENAALITSHLQNIYGLHVISEHVKGSLDKTARHLKINKKWTQS